MNFFWLVRWTLGKRKNLSNAQSLLELSHCSIDFQTLGGMTILANWININYGNRHRYAEEQSAQDVKKCRAPVRSGFIEKCEAAKG